MSQQLRSVYQASLYQQVKLLLQLMQHRQQKHQLRQRLRQRQHRQRLSNINKTL